MASTIVGLDIGNGVLRAAEIADPGKARPTLLRYHTVTVPSGAIVRGEVMEQSTVASALKQLWSAGKFKSKKVVLGMGNHRVLVRDVTVPAMPLAQIKESLPFQVQELLPVPVADAILDFYPISGGKSDAGDVINGLLVAAVKDSVLRAVNAVQEAGLDPVEVDLIPFALSRSLLSTSEAKGTVALVHVGAMTTSVIVADSGVPQFVRIIQNGGEDVTNALVQQLGLEPAQADQVKRGFGLATSGVSPEWRPAVETIARTTGDLLDGVRNTLSFYMNTRHGSRIDRIFVSGGGAQLPGFPQALAEATRIPVGMPNALARFTVAKSADADGLRADSAGVPVAAGLAMGSKAA
jgi:type IV pilus assembly protein PilM